MGCDNTDLSNGVASVSCKLSLARDSGNEYALSFMKPCTLLNIEHALCSSAFCTRTSSAVWNTVSTSTKGQRIINTDQHTSAS